MPTRTTAGSSSSGRIVTLLLLVVVSTLLLLVVTEALVLPSPKEENKDDDETAFLLRLEEMNQNVLFQHVDSTESTQEECKRIVEEEQQQLLEEKQNHYSMVCVTAAEQSNGRGTSGRVWMGAKGNAFVTIAIQQQQWMKTKIPLTLLPLQIGIFVAKRVQQLIQECNNKMTTNNNELPFVTLKWPNDVLVNEQKIAGILIESSNNGWFLIGIGVNVAYAPPVPTTGPNYGRTSTSVSSFCKPTITGSWHVMARQLGMNLASDLNLFLKHPPSIPMSIIQEWKEWADLDMELVMRDTPNKERVKVVDMLPDGRIQVVGQDDGVHRTLVSDYFL